MDFFNDIFHNLALLEFYFLNIIYILLYIDLILSIFFQHSNILTRASHHWCLASNIVLVPLDVLPPWVTRTSAAMILTKLNGDALVFPETESQQPSGFQCWAMIGNTNLYIITFPKKWPEHKGLKESLSFTWFIWDILVESWRPKIYFVPWKLGHPHFRIFPTDQF